MEIAEEDYLQLSGIQHFCFCRRQWALIHIEQLWTENLRTVEGNLLHENAHNPFFTEKRKDLIVTRELPVCSRVLGVSGKCDVVEFHEDSKNGVTLAGRRGKWRPCPVEYKRGQPKISDADRLQLCAQAVCLEEMLVCSPIEQAFLFYDEIKRREAVELTSSLREQVQVMFGEMHDYFSRSYTPRVKPTKSCNACSLKDRCLPRLSQSSNSVAAYISKATALEEK